MGKTSSTRAAKKLAPQAESKQTGGTAPKGEPTAEKTAKPSQLSAQQFRRSPAKAAALPSSPAPAEQAPTAPPKPEPAKTVENAAKVIESTTRSTSPVVKVTFALVDLGAKLVFLSGEFNGWSREATPMRLNKAGHWETSLGLAPGRYQYKFIVDGEWIPDPLARETVWNRHGTLNSVIDVRA